VPEPDGWVHPALDVRPSEVAGRGLFATEDLPAGTVVVRLAGGHEECGRVDRLGPRFFNHGCDPNVGWVDEHVLAAMVEIAAGTELLVDYAMSTVDPEWFLRCHCPSYRCRQMVEGTDWRIAQLRPRYDGWWAPHVQRLIRG
jgi:hypothetical protein